MGVKRAKHAIRWLAAAVPLVVGSIAVVAGWSLLPTLAIAAETDRTVPWFLTWSFVGLAATVAIVLAVLIVSSGTSPETVEHPIADDATPRAPARERVVLRSLLAFLTTLWISAGCAAQKPSEKAAETPDPSSKPYATLLQLMRAIDFPDSNIVFDTQTTDPGAAPDPKAKPPEGGTVTSSFAGLFGGWERVENSALAVAETANLMMVPGRVCSNGKPVPVHEAEFQKGAAGLAEAAMTAYRAAQARNLDAMVEVSGTLTEACAVCHHRYRDGGPAGSPARCVDAAPAGAKS